MSDVSNPTLARERLAAQVEGIGRLRGSGPNPFDYTIWDERTAEVIGATFGADSSQLAQYLEAADIRGRLPGVRGQAENMTLNIHGQWGILGRLQRAEVVLNSLIASLA
ncbi:MAG: hypothetical protein ABIP13_00565 [Tepidiformaceae bacterium]